MDWLTLASGKKVNLLETYSMQIMIMYIPFTTYQLSTVHDIN
jgi:hypothetical protein